MSKKDTTARRVTKTIVRSQLGALGWFMGDQADAAVDAAFDKFEAAPSTAAAEDMAFKQRLGIDLMKARAAAAQELALAIRMATAEEVELEEHYDGSGEGMLGLDAKADAKTETVGGALGLKGSGRVMRKRVIRLKGGHDGEAPMEWVQQNLAGESE